MTPSTKMTPMWSPTPWLSIESHGVIFWRADNGRISPNFQKVKCFQQNFRKILVFSPRGHFPEIIHPSATSPRRGAAGTPRQNPICASNQMNGPPRAGADRFSDRHTPYGIFFYWKRSGIWPKISRKADRLIIILSHYNYNIFFYKNQPDRSSFSRSVKMPFSFIITYFF